MVSGCSLIIKHLSLTFNHDILQSIPGMGPETARTIIVECQDLGEGEAAQLCALAGVVPFNCDSGRHRGQCRIYGGRALLRSALYMAAQSAVKCTKTDNVFKQMYERITAKRPHKVGIIAVAHKMLTLPIHWSKTTHDGKTNY